nr:hypothetical protein [uncultured Psychroserpens sp.]
MSEKKNIDKLFKEQLKNFEVAPSDAVWENIEAELNKDKRKRRVIPIWWKVAGVAASLLLVFTVASTLINDAGNNPIHKVVDTKNSNNNTNGNNEQSNDSNLDTNSNSNSYPVVDNDNKSNEQNKTNLNSNTDNTSTNSLTSTNKNDENTSIKISEEKENNNGVNENYKTKSLINNNSKKQNTIASNKTNTIKGDNETSNTNSTVAKNTTKNTVSDRNLNDDIKKEKSEIDKLIKQNKTKSSTQVTTSNSTSEKEKNQILIDTTKNAIENAIAQTEKEDKENIKDSINPLIKRWTVAPNMAPVYFNTLGNGSSIDDQFVDNTKEGDVNVSYGIKGTYAINKKFTIRAGINKVNLGYSTNNVVAFANPNANNPGLSRALQNVSSSDSTTTYISANTISFATGPEVLFLKEKGSISQQLGFIEVPIELEYNVLNTKIGVNLIGGFSTLFLSDNDVYSVENNGAKTRLGEASNINDMSYSANFGIGINYDISQQLRFNLEPTFKYQINTFNDTSGDFQPFFIGVYTGLSFKF